MTALATVMSEAQLLSTVRDIARLYGVMTYHTHRSDRSDPGFPDLVLLGHGRCLFRELKTEKGRVRAEQKQWLDELTANGYDAGIWRPSDLQSGRIARELQPRGNR